MKTLRLEDVVPVSDTHNLYSQGYGHKIHIMNNKARKCLCGYESSMFNEIFLDGVYNNIVEYIAQPDPDNNLCKRCKNILIDNLTLDE